MFDSEIMPEKIRLYCQYAVHATMWTDTLVILDTIQLLLAPGSRWRRER
jgi:lipopolysaccharide/colanic/teichoic acid biosynthesis glycosyltransferase